MQDCRERVERALDAALPVVEPEYLCEAMRYAVLGGGKRVRPVLVYAAGHAVDAPLEALDTPACAVECLHAYSLVHDDLPAMDDDALRRGLPTCHRAYGVANAILAGDALQTRAFEILADSPMPGVDASVRVRMFHILSTAAGAPGMCGGQAIDLAAVGSRLTLDDLEQMHRLKTGALIRASVRLGAMCRADLDAGTLDHLDGYAEALGLAFQIVDDILDVNTATETLGKTKGADVAHDKPTYPALLGLDGARAEAVAMRDRALAHLTTMDAGAEPLRQIAYYVVERSH